jgi:hypothetical protein
LELEATGIKEGVMLSSAIAMDVAQLIMGLVRAVSLNPMKFESPGVG